MKPASIIGVSLGVITWLLRQHLPPPLAEWFIATNREIPLAWLVANVTVFIGWLAAKLRYAVEGVRISHTSEYWVIQFYERFTPYLLTIRAFVVAYLWAWAYWNIQFYEPSTVVRIESVSLVLASLFLMLELPERIYYFFLTASQGVRTMRKLIRSLFGNRERGEQAKTMAVVPTVSTLNRPATALNINDVFTGDGSEIPSGDNDPVWRSIQDFLEGKRTTKPWTPIDANLDEAEQIRLKKELSKEAESILGMSMPDASSSLRVHLAQRDIAPRLKLRHDHVWTSAANCYNALLSLGEGRANLKDSPDLQRYEALSGVNPEAPENRQEIAGNLEGMAWETVRRARELWVAVRAAVLLYKLHPVLGVLANRRSHNEYTLLFLAHLACVQNPDQALDCILTEMPMPRKVLPNGDPVITGIVEAELGPSDADSRKQALNQVPIGFQLNSGADEASELN